MAVCTRCGSESPDGFRFCGNCGAPLEQTAAPRQTRKVVTALFCDVTGSTALGEELDPEVLRGVMNRYFSEMRATIERHGGTVEKFIGDAVMAVFGIPTVREDDALRAVRAAAEIREQLPAVAQEVGVTLRFRTGVNTGPVLMGEGENIAIGDAVNVAARLEQAAAPGEIVLGEETLRLVRDAVEVEPLEPLELKGKSEPIPAFRLLAVDPVSPGVARHMDALFVGRRRELRALRDAWDVVVEESRCQLFTLLGTAGVGKTRLTGELLAGLGDTAMMLRGRCLHYGEGITFWPLVEALMAVGDAAKPVLERLDHGGAATPEELFWEVRRLLESLAAERPLILHIDDLHWAEPMMLDLIDHVADLSRGAPILLLCTARPELLEDRPSWGGGKLNATAVLLEPLGAADSATLLEQLGGLDPEVRSRVIDASEGNPLFLEEMAALARERGTVSVPPTIQALLAARLERLERRDRELLERGAVEGEIFHRTAVRALASEPLANEVGPRLAGLVRKELIRPAPATLQGDDAFRFRHLLIRDAAYDGMPKAARAELHERFARWLERAAQGLVELDEIAGWHLEQAVTYRRELGQPVDADLAQAAAAHLESAGRHAARRADSAAARNLLARAFTLAPEGGTLRARIALELADQTIRAGDLALVDEVLAVAEADPDTETMAALLRLDWMIAASPHGAVSAIEAQLPALLEQFQAAGDERGLARAHAVAFMAHWLGSRATPAAEEARETMAHAAAAGDEGLRSLALSMYIATLMYGRANAEEMTLELDRIEREGVPGAWTQAFVAVARAQAALLEGLFEDGMRHAREAGDGFAALRSGFEAFAYQLAADIERTQGNPEAALSRLERADVILERSHERSFRSTNQANIAVVHAALGEADKARAAIDTCEELSAPEDVINYAFTHRVRSQLARTTGDLEQAEQSARSAVEYALTSDFPGVQANARLELARVLVAQGRREECEIEAREALALRESKGDRPGAAEVRALLDELASPV